MKEIPVNRYLQLMKVIRERLDIFQKLDGVVDNFSKAEIAAFHGRKIIEGIAFGCLVAVENKITEIPGDVKGQYNAEKILKRLNARDKLSLPSPSALRKSTPTEMANYGSKGTIEGIPAYRIDVEELIRKYQRMHGWLHELNPYTKEGRESFYKLNSNLLWSDLADLDNFLNEHVMTLRGEGFFCLLRDPSNNQTKVISISKIGDL